MNSVEIDGKRYLSSKGTSAIIGYHPDHVRLLARTGVIPFIQIRNKYFFNPDEVMSVLRSDISTKGRELKEPETGARDNGDTFNDDDIVFDI